MTTAKDTQKHVSRITDGALVVGTVVAGESRGPRYVTRWTGTYDGTRPSEWDGQPTHYFTDGSIGDTPQRIFGFAVADFSAGA
jgi:hypothetical protein